eukprot:9510967-Alexandrium_andersonii.AAC.1
MQLLAARAPAPSEERGVLYSWLSHQGVYLGYAGVFRQSRSECSGVAQSGPVEASVVASTCGAKSWQG